MKQLVSGAVALSAGIILLGGCASGETSRTRLEPAKLGAMERVHAFDGVFLASQPGPDDLKAAREAGVKTVVNLRKKDELNWDEKAVIEGLGLEYHSVPFVTATELTDDVFDETRKILADPSKRPLLLHCASANRVGAVWLVHRVVDDGVPVEKALEEAKAAGLRGVALEEKALEYIEKQKK